MGYLSRINQVVVVLTALLTFYVFLNNLTYLYVITLAFLGQIIYTAYGPFGPERKRKTQQEATEQLHNKIDGLNDTIKAQRGMIEVFLKVNARLSENVKKDNTT